MTPPRKFNAISLIYKIDTLTKQLKNISNQKYTGYYKEILNELTSTCRQFICLDNGLRITLQNDEVYTFVNTGVIVLSDSQLYTVFNDIAYIKAIQLLIKTTAVHNKGTAIIH